MAYYITSFNSVDLQATCGVVTPGVGGVHDLPVLDVDVAKLPGGPVPHLTVLSDDFRTVEFADAVVVGTGHTDLVAKLRSLRGYLRPDDDFHPLVVQDRPTERIMALCVSGFRVNTQCLPNEYDAVRTKLAFLCYPYWEDLTELSVTIAEAFLDFKQATFEDSALGDCGWHVLDAGSPETVTTDPYAGDYCMKVTTSAVNPTDGAKTPEAGITGITAAEKYSVSLWMKGAVGGETVQLAIRWFTAASAFISEVTSNLTITDEWAQYKFENQEAAALATKASLQLRDAHAAVWYVDDVCFEEAAACGDFITPADADTKVYNGGDKTCYPVYTCTVLVDMPTGLTFDFGDYTFTYDGPLYVDDVLVIDSDPGDRSVTLNDAANMAEVNVGSDYPKMVTGWNAVSHDEASFTLGMAFRRRYY